MHPLVELEDKARQHAQKGEHEQSVQTYKELLRLEPNWEKGLGCYELAYRLEQIGRNEEALKYYQKAISQRPHDDYFWFGYAYLAAQHGDAQDALTYLLKILRGNANSYLKETVGKLLAVAGKRAGKTQEMLLREVREVTTDPKIIESLLAN